MIGTSSVVLYAFDAGTRHYLGARHYYDSVADKPIYSNIRQWVVANKQLYTGVATPGENPLSGGGRILRWVGHPSVH